MTTRRVYILALVALISSSLCLPSVAQEDSPDNDHAYLDGATNPNPIVREEKATLLAPNIRANRIALPPTSPPYRDGAASGESTAQPILLVGYIIDAPPNLIAGARWERLAAMRGWVCRLELRSANAVGLRLQFRGRLDSGITIQIYHPDGSVVLPVRAYPDEEGYWWAPTLWYSDTNRAAIVRKNK